MKKILSLLLVLSLAFTLAACGDKDKIEELVCTGEQVLNAAKDACVDPDPVVTTCPDGQELVGDTCQDIVVVVDPTCTATQQLIDGECVDDAVCPTGTSNVNHVCKLDGLVLAGLPDLEVDSGTSVDLLDGVTATGSDGTDYSSSITLQSDTCTIVDGSLFKDTGGACAVTYNVIVDGILAREERTITWVIDPNSVDTLADMRNQEFTDADISDWVIEGTLVLTHDPAGYLVVEVSALGGDPWSQNIGNINHIILPGTEYEVSYTLKTAYAEGRDVTFFVEDVNNGYSKYFEETRTLTNEFQTFTFTFTPDAFNDDTKLGIFLGNTSNPMIGTVIIDSITITAAGGGNVAPVITGADDVVLNVDAEFDARQGVVATDFEDGDLTVYVAVQGVVDVTTPGTYVLTYTVIDFNGGIARVFRTVKVEDKVYMATDILTNGMFDASPWGFWAADWNSTSVTATFDGTQVSFDIADAGPDNWAIQLFQENLQLVNGMDYVVTFDAMSTVGRDIRVKLIDSSGAEVEGDVTLTDTMGTYTVTFLAYTGLTGNVKLDFELGNVGTVAPAASVVTFDNVMVEEWDGAAVVVDSNKVMDSAFEILPTEGWSVWARDWDPVVTATFDVVMGEAVVTYDGYGDAVWQVRLQQTGLTFVPGETYKLTFKAKGDVARDFEVGFYDGGSGQQMMFDLDTEYGFYTWVFTYEIGANSPIEFKLGASPMAAGSMFYLDNVVIEILVD